MNKYTQILLVVLGGIIIGFLGISFFQSWKPAIAAACFGFAICLYILLKNYKLNSGTRRPRFAGSRPRHIPAPPDPVIETAGSTSTSPRLSWWSRLKNRFSRRRTGAATANPADTETETSTSGSSWSWLWWIVVIAALAGAWWYFELPWQFIPHALALLLALYGLVIKDSLSQFHRLTPVLVILTVGLGVVLTPQNPEWAWMLTTGATPLLVAIAYALANELHHQQSVSAAAVASFIWMLVYALFTTFGFDPIAVLVIGFILALGSIFWIPEIRERTGVTAPSEPMSSSAKWAIGLVVAAIIIIALSNSYGTAWLSNLLEGLPKIAWFVFWALVLIFLWAQKEQTLNTTTKVWLTILILAIGLYWITLAILAAIAKFFGGIFAFLTSEWWIIAIVAGIFILLMWMFLRHMRINPLWVGGIVLLIWILAYSGLFDGTRGISYPVLTPSGGVEQNIDHGFGNDPETLRPVQ